MDTAVSRDCKTRMTYLHTAWIDYKKSYDSIPHTWILESSKQYKISRTAFIKNSMGQWKSNLEANLRQIDQVSIQYGIYQGDYLLLFSTSLSPGSHSSQREALDTS